MKRIALATIRASNTLITGTFASSLVAIFIGATSGIGEYTLLEFAKCAPGSSIYFVGRSFEDGKRVKAKVDVVNKGGACTFIQMDVSLLKNVDEICQEIKNKEEKINLLFMTQGTLDLKSGMIFPSYHCCNSNAEIAITVTSEGIPTALALLVYSRTRFIVNLLPLLDAAGERSIARVVSVATGTHEGPIDMSDIDLANLSLLKPLKTRGHAASMITLTMDHIAQQASKVSFIHAHPGPVYSKIDRTMTGWLAPLKWLIRFLMLFKSMSATESGERHFFLATSAMWPAAMGGSEGIKLPHDAGLRMADGIDGEQGSGVYTVEEYGRGAGEKVRTLLRKYREDGTRSRLWEHLEGRFVAITGSPSS